MASAAIVVLGLLGSGAALPSADAANATRGPVVLELFTSQGCSSCPRADRVLSRLGLDAETRAKVVPLEFHVDYWNQVGWVDPFSAREWSVRQDTYSRALGVASVYTPQLVVDGRVEFSGGNEQRALLEVAASLARPAPANVSLATRTRQAKGTVLTVDVAVEMTESVEAGKLQLLVALFENGLVTAVARGENGGRKLRNDFIVRRLESAFSLEPRAGARRRRAFDLELDRAWRLESVGIAAFLQDPRSMRIYGAAALSPVR